MLGIGKVKAVKRIKNLKNPCVQRDHEARLAIMTPSIGSLSPRRIRV
jgi:hypothetical protein